MPICTLLRQYLYRFQLNTGMATDVNNDELRAEIYRSQLTYTDLPRKEQRALPAFALHVDTHAEIPQGFAGLVKVDDPSYLPASIDPIYCKAHGTTAFRPPFKPFQLIQNGQVIASAFLRDGAVSVHGRLTERLGALVYQTVTGYAENTKFSGYTYIDDMISFALEQAMIPVLRYDERVSMLPFAFLTRNTHFAFLKVIAKEKQIADRRNKLASEGMAVCQWSAWTSDQNEADNSAEAILEELYAEMDVLLSEELRRRDSIVAIPRKQKYKLSMSPMLSLAIKYGLKIGLSSAAISVCFGLNEAVVSRVKNDAKRSKAV
jgi:hypothetical protein